MPIPLRAPKTWLLAAALTCASAHANEPPPAVVRLWLQSGPGDFSALRDAVDALRGRLGGCLSPLPKHRPVPYNVPTDLVDVDVRLGRDGRVVSAIVTSARPSGAGACVERIVAESVGWPAATEAVALQLMVRPHAGNPTQPPAASRDAEAARREALRAVPVEHRLADDLALGDPIIMGSLDREIIVRVFHEAGSTLRACWPGAPGARAVTKITIDRDGHVREAFLRESDSPDDVNACLLDRVRALRFPAPQGGGIVIATLPLLGIP
jgi:hypothetical protein